MDMHLLPSSSSQHRRNNFLSRWLVLPAVLLTASTLLTPVQATQASASHSVATAKKNATSKIQEHGNKKIKHTRRHARAVETTSGAAVPASIPPIAVPAADAQQLAAFDRINLGISHCEFNQQVSVQQSAQHPGYVELGYKTHHWLMKPVLSSTGALRLEDVNAETLFIQIRNKSMLMNQKTGQRLVDGCVHPNQQAMQTP